MKRVAAGIVSVGACAALLLFTTGAPFDLNEALGLFLVVGALGLIPLVIGVVLQLILGRHRVPVLATLGLAIAIALSMALTPDFWDVELLDSLLLGAVFTFALSFGFAEIGVAAVLWVGRTRLSGSSEATEA
ncbi:MAG: hypothetical protein ACYDHQ_06615 [Coriobacteriia bacterium]